MTPEQRDQLADTLSRVLVQIALREGKALAGDEYEIADAVAPLLDAEVDRLHTWDGLMSLLDEHWPESVFPTIPDDDTRDPGPRIVSLLRWVASLRETVERVEALLATHPSAVWVYELRAALAPDGGEPLLGSELPDYELPDSELPGMWESSDFSGGWADSEGEVR